MNDRACGSRSVFFSWALLVCASAGLAGCGGGGDATATPVSSNAPAPEPTPAPTPTPDPTDPSPAPTPTPVPQPGANSAPTITGTAVTSLSPYTAYSFTPAASDADGDELAFQIQNKPAWATFSTITGALSGTPTFAHAGEYADIVITATDGQATASLPSFSIRISEATIDGDTLLWTAPTANVDGSALDDLAGFTIVYGPSSTTLYQSVRIANPSVDRYVIEDFPAGTHYFAVKAYTVSGVESALSNVVSKVVQ